MVPGAQWLGLLLAILIVPIAVSAPRWSGTTHSTDW
jgi:hypothetical protein